MRQTLLFLKICLMAALVPGLCSCGASQQAAQSYEDEEVVSVGYGAAKKLDVTYAVSSVKVSDEEMVYSNMYDYLRGRVPGVVVGAGNTIQIRGVNSINSSTEPLVIFDGMEADLNAINPNDVHSVDVLKDSSSSIYGVRGANGVIIVTSKAAYQMQVAADEAKRKAKEEKKAARKAKRK